MDSSAPRIDSFPRRHARTRRFTLGQPRTFQISADGQRVLFLRSGGGEDPVNRLWQFDVADGSSRQRVDPALLGGDDHELPPAERARRERAREGGEGIVTYDADPSLSIVIFAVGGQVYRQEAGKAAEQLPSAEGAFDPRLSSDATQVAYVSGDTLRVTGAGGDRVLMAEAGVSWGSAEFVAGEEMGRTRGYWWAPDSRRLAVTRVDTASVPQWWIADPVHPDAEPTPIRYPAAGANNAVVDLAIIGLDGSRVDVNWNEDGWEYLADLAWTDDGLMVTAQSRDQRVLVVLDVDAATGRCDERYRVEDPDWVELVPGVPRLDGDQLITIEDRGAARRLCVDGRQLTGDDLQIKSLVAVDEGGYVVTASSTPTRTKVVRVTREGAVTDMTPDAGVAAAVAKAGTAVMVRDGLDLDARTVSVMVGDEVVGLIDNSAEPLDFELRMSQLSVAPNGQATAVLLPTDHDGKSPLPVLLDPYGGPHAQRVVESKAAFGVSQWFADQGFAVIVHDGRGTSGLRPAGQREVRGDLASGVLDDQIAALDAAATQFGFLDLDRVAIRGWSFGGYLAALAVLRRPDRFHAAVAGAPVTDWRLYDTHYTERYLGHPDAEPDNYVNNDLTADAANLERPLLLIHGLADDNVVAAHTLALSRALLEAGRPHQVLPLSGVTHMTPQEEVAENLLLVQLAFLREHLDIA